MTEVYDLQRKVNVETADLFAFTEQCLDLVVDGEPRTVSVALVSDRRMRQLNELFRGKNTTTDVLSFPHESDQFDPDNKTLGDIVISAEQAQKQAGENGLLLEIELKQLILHGMLHLCGYDHETDDGEMNEREITLRSQLKIS
jgi:probable rRNA maturation factor